MSDDFMAEVNEAITSINNAPPTPTNVSTEEQQQDVLGILEAHETPITSNVKKPKETKQQEKPAQETQQQETQQQQQEEKPVDQTTQQQQTQQTQQQRKTVPYMDQFLKQDDKNNLVLADGTIIATAGPSRTFFEKLKSEARKERESNRQLALSNIQLSQRFKDLYDESEQVKTNPERESLEKRTNMKGAELDEAIDLIREYNVNPIGAIKKLLTQAQLRGINLKEIGINGALEPSVVKQMLEDIVSKREVQETPSQEKSQASAVKEATDFLEAFPEAAQHTELLAAARRKFPNKSYAELWHNFVIWQQDKAALEEEELAKKPVTNQQKQPAQQKQNKSVVTPNVTDYSKLSFREIAEGIKKDLKA